MMNRILKMRLMKFLLLIFISQLIPPSNAYAFDNVKIVVLDAMPNGFSVSKDESTLFFPHYVWGNYVSVADVETASVFKKISVGAPTGVFETPDSSEFFIAANRRSRVHRMDAENLEIGDTYGFSGPQRISFSPDGQYLYIDSRWGSYLSKRKVSDFSEVGRAGSGREPWGHTLSLDGKRAYTANSHDSKYNAITEIDTDTMKVIRAISIPEMSGYYGPTGVKMSPKGNLYARHWNKDVFKVDLLNNQHQKILSNTNGLDFTEDGEYMVTVGNDRMLRILKTDDYTVVAEHDLSPYIGTNQPIYKVGSKNFYFGTRSNERRLYIVPLSEVIPVPSTPEEVIPFVEELLESGCITNHGVANAISSSLENAQRNLETSPVSAKNMLGATINKIEAQSGKKVCTEGAEELIGHLNSIIENI